MQTEVFSALFPLLSTSNSETVEWLLSVAVEHEYPTDRAVVMEDSWGNAVYLIVSGWVKVRRLSGANVVTLAILGRGDFFGEMAILDESPRSTDVIALSRVKLISISAQCFIQALFKDPQLHHRMLQLMVRRLRQTNVRFELQHHPPAVKLAFTLVTLGEIYGQPTPHGTSIFNVPPVDLADVSDISLEETTKIMEKLESKGWLAVDSSQQVIYLTNEQQLMNLISKV